jgi:hypothetical protein
MWTTPPRPPTTTAPSSAKHEIGGLHRKGRTGVLLRDPRGPPADVLHQQHAGAGRVVAVDLLKGHRVPVEGERRPDAAHQGVPAPKPARATPFQLARVVDARERAVLAGVHAHVGVRGDRPPAHAAVAALPPGNLDGAGGEQRRLRLLVAEPVRARPRQRERTVVHARRPGRVEHGHTGGVELVDTVADPGCRPARGLTADGRPTGPLGTAAPGR